MKSLKPILALVTVAVVMITVSLVVKWGFLSTLEENSGQSFEAKDFPATTLESTTVTLDKPEETFKDYVLSVMDTCKAPLSPASREITAENLSHMVPSRISSRTNQELYILLLCIENKFQRVGKSSVGATGIAQIMPKYAQEFSDLCGLGSLKEGDLDDSMLNATLGACLFQNLIERLGSPVLAVAAYNAGAASSSVKNLKALSAPVPETAAYVAKISYLQETMNAK